MKKISELLPGVFLLETQKFQDRRGSLSVPFHYTEIEVCIGRPFTVSQTMMSVSYENVLRGLHYQIPAAPVAKLIRCHRGAIFDVVLDIRAESTTYGKWVGTELIGGSNLQIYAPPGVAHGYFSFSSRDAEVFYYQDGLYRPDAGHVIAWDDPDLGIRWPKGRGKPILSDRDNQGMSWADYKRKPAF